MLLLNARALELATSVEVGAMTDVTGYGLIGHLADLAKQSGLGAVLHSAAVPLLPRALELTERGYVPGGTKNNLDFVEPDTAWAATLTESQKLLLCDAQTSGGLLLSVASEDSEGLVEKLRAEGHSAAVIGHLESGTPGRVRVI
jgi:selenide,water dikinase